MNSTKETNDLVVLSGSHPDCNSIRSLAKHIETTFALLTNTQGQKVFAVSYPAIRIGPHGKADISLSLEAKNSGYENIQSDLPKFRAHIQRLCSTDPVFREFIPLTFEYIEILFPDKVFPKFQATFAAYINKKNGGASNSPSN